MIAFLISELDIRGGTHKQFLKLLEFTEQKGEDFYIITQRVDFNKTYPALKKYNDRIRIFDIEKGSNPISKYFARKKNIQKLHSMLKDADVANIHDCGFELFLNAFKGIPTIWQINDLPTLFQVGVAAQSKNTLKNKIFRRIVLSSLKNINEITVNVSKNAERVNDKLNRTAKVLYCGIEPLGIKINTDASLSRFHNKKINLLSSGVWLPYRNYETQVEIVRILTEKGYDVNLNIIGSTSYSPEYLDSIKSKINEYNLNKKIHICGMVDEKQFVELHQNADLFMFINVDQSWGLAVFEAMSCGIPVIVGNSVGATEILHDKIDSIFVEPKSAESIAKIIINLTQSSDQFKQLSERSTNFCSDYTWDKAYSEPMLKILQSFKNS